MNAIRRAIYWLDTMYRVIRRRLLLPGSLAASDDGKTGIEEAQ